MRTLFVMSCIAALIGCRSTHRDDSATKDAVSNVGPSNAAFERFEKWIEQLNPILGKELSAQEAANGILDASKKNRAVMFSMQALGRLYEKQNPEFEMIRQNFKSLEDGIGEFDKWSELYSKGEKTGVGPDNLKKFSEGKDLARQAFADSLRDQSWVETSQPRLRAIHDFLQGYDWLPYNEERNILIKAMDKQISKIGKKEWDLSSLEGKAGLHELKRELRWFQIEAQVLNGLVAFREDSNDCPVEEFKALLSEPIAQNPFSQLPIAPGEVNPCFISQCLYLAGATFVSELDAIKQEAELYAYTTGVEFTNEVPAKFQERAGNVLKSLVGAGYVSHISSQLNACIH
ncbi:MAG: hypothetical protein AB7T49_12985 [Oligoflexales bacterium]